VRGFHSVTMDEVAFQAGISKRTVYRYFRSKEEIIEAALDAFMAGVVKESERLIITEQDSASIISGFIKYIFTQGRFFASPQGLKDLQQYYPHLWQKIDVFRAGRIHIVIEAVLSRDKNEIIREIDPRIITAVILASIQAVVNPDFILKNGLTFEETVNQMSKLLIQAFFKD